MLLACETQGEDLGKHPSPLSFSIISLRQQKRVLICISAALASGFFSSYVGGQISLTVHRHNCQTQPWGFKTVCEAWVTPGAIWQGSTTGLWLGTMLGAFVSGWVTRKSEKAIASSNSPVDARQKLTAVSCADDLELTPAQREALEHLLVLLLVKLGSSSETTPDLELETLSLDELQHLVAVAKQKPLLKQNLTLEEIRQLLK